MSRKMILFCIAIFLFSSFCYVALAQSVDDTDSSGNIKVELTRLDENQSYTFILMAIVAVLIILISTLVFVLRHRSFQTSSRKDVEQVDDISIKQVKDDSFRDRGYYEKVFDKEILPKMIADERSNITHLIDEKASSDNSVDRYLKEDERIIINVLRMKHNSCSQATLRVVTDFSKARLSRLLSELEERGIIYKEQSGRKNLITLKT